MSLRLHVAEQGGFFTYAPLEPLADGRAFIVHSSALLCLSADTLAQFAAHTQAAVETEFATYLADAGVTDPANEAGILVLDMEEPGDPAAGKFVSPMAFWRYTDPADRTTCIEGWKLRIRAARAVLPKARLALYATLTPDERGIDTATYLPRLAALRDEGGPQGLYDGLDFLLPVLVTRYGPDDGADYYTLEARIRQGLTGSAQLKKSDGSSLPLIPFFNPRVENSGAVAGSLHDKEQTIDFDPSLERTFLLPMEMCEQAGVTEAIFWAANPTGETLPGINPNGWTVTDYIRRLYMATTFKLIRNRQVELLEALTPTLRPALGRFKQWEHIEGGSFEGWADSASQPMRVFHIVHGLDYDNDERYLDQNTEEAAHTETVLVAYPNLEAFAGERMDDLVDADLVDITKAIGLRGYGSYDALGDGEHACIRQQTAIEIRGAARILRITFAIKYDRSIP